jgi:hypothetical protein
MKTAILMTLLAIAPAAMCQAPTCHGTPLLSESEVLNILASSTPSSRSPETRQCIASAIDYAGELRSKAAIPQLVRYLSFYKGSPAEKHPTFLLHPFIEGEDYPAVLALASIGVPARSVLLNVIESESASLIERQNATHAIVLSFLSGTKPDPGKAILFLRSSKTHSDTATQKRVDQMIGYALTTHACVRFAPKCADATKQPVPSE